MTDIKETIAQAAHVAAEAQLLREDLRWTVKPGDPNREEQIDSMIEEIRLAMIPVRSWIGRAEHGQVRGSQEETLRNVSLDLQYHRKQLKKMRRHR